MLLGKGKPCPFDKACLSSYNIVHDDELVPLNTGHAEENAHDVEF